MDHQMPPTEMGWAWALQKATRTFYPVFCEVFITLGLELCTAKSFGRTRTRKTRRQLKPNRKIWTQLQGAGEKYETLNKSRYREAAERIKWIKKTNKIKRDERLIMLYHRSMAYHLQSSGAQPPIQQALEPLDAHIPAKRFVFVQPNEKGQIKTETKKALITHYKHGCTQPADPRGTHKSV